MFHFGSINLGLNPMCTLQKQVETFLMRDDNSTVTPDVKKAIKGIRYRLPSLEKFYERFIVDESVECSYFQFTRYMPNKAKIEKLDYMLCMICLSAELKWKAKN